MHDDSNKRADAKRPGSEREEGFIILMSRMEQAAVGSVLRILGRWHERISGHF